MKKILLILFAFISINASSQPIVGETVGVKDLIYWIKDDYTIDSLIQESDTAGKYRYTNVAAPIDSSDAVPKWWVESNMGGDIYPISADSVNMDTISGATYITLQDWSNGVQSSGIITGGLITDGGSGTVDVSTMSGIIKKTNSEIGENEFFDKAGETGLTLTDENTNYISLDYNSGAPQIIISTSNTANGYTIFNIGKVFREGVKVDIITSGLRIEDFSKRIQQHHLEESNLHFVSGATVTETGTRNIAISAGVMYAGLNRLPTDAINTAVTDDFEYYYNDATGWVETDETQIDNLQYNDYGVGLATLSNNRYGVHFVYKGTNETTYVVYGIDSYTLAEAQGLSIPTNLPNHVSEFGALRAKIIIAKSGIVFTEIEGIDDIEFIPSTPSNHNDLGLIQGGAAGDYYHLTQNEVVKLQDSTGLWVLNGSDIYRETGNVAIGKSTADVELDVEGDVLISGSIGIGTTTPVAKLHSSATGSSDVLKLERLDAGGFLEVDFASQWANFNSDEAYVFKIDGTERVRWNTNGNVGINTTTPSEKLEVNGNIIADAATLNDHVLILSQFEDTVAILRAEIQVLEANSNKSINNANYSGLINGTNTTFVTDSAFQVSSSCVYRNGQRLDLGSTYTETDSVTIEFATAPLSGNSIVIDIIKN